MLSLENVSKTYRMGNRAAAALHRVSLTVAPGEFVAITCRSAAGQGALLAVMGGLARPDAGRVRWWGQDLWVLSDAHRSRLRSQTCGFVFPFASLLPTLRVLENVMLPGAFGARGSGPDGARELLARVGLGEQADRYPSQLSGDQQQRVAIARALYGRPRLLLAGAPAPGLDGEAEMALLFRDLTREGTAVVMVSHNHNLVRLAGRHLVLAGSPVTR